MPSSKVFEDGPPPSYETAVGESPHVESHGGTPTNHTPITTAPICGELWYALKADKYRQMRARLPRSDVEVAAKELARKEEIHVNQRAERESAAGG